MRYRLPPAAREVAESWLETRVVDPDDCGDDADAQRWLDAIRAGDGVADLPTEAWRIIADDIEQEASSDVPFEAVMAGKELAGQAYRNALRRTANRILAAIG